MVGRVIQRLKLYYHMQLLFSNKPRVKIGGVGPNIFRRSFVVIVPDTRIANNCCRPSALAFLTQSFNHSLRSHKRRPPPDLVRMASLAVPAALVATQLSASYPNM